MKKYMLALMTTYCFRVKGIVKNHVTMSTLGWRNNKKKFPTKVLCYLPLIPKLVGLCQSFKIAEDMI